LLTPRPTPKLEDQPLSAVRDCIFNIFAVTINIGGRSSIRNLRTRHSVVTGTHLSRTAGVNFVINSSKASEQTHAHNDPSTGNLLDVLIKTGQWSSKNKYLRNSYDQISNFARNSCKVKEATFGGSKIKSHFLKQTLILKNKVTLSKTNFNFKK
jgi:hypothetical protein